MRGGREEVQGEWSARAPDGQQGVQLAVHRVRIVVKVAADDVRVLNSLPQTRLEHACALQRRRHAQL